MTTEQEPREVSQIVGECAGAVSVCWSDISQAGTFDSTQAAKHVEAAVAELNAEIERLLTANDTLARHVAASSARLEEGKRELLATGWDACAEIAQTGPPNKAANPYRQPIGFGADQ